MEFENTNILGQAKTYSRFKVPVPYMYPEYVLNRAYADTDVFVSMAKLKNHADCGVTLSLKNCFGIVPVSIYGDDAGEDEPNEQASRAGRECATWAAASRPKSRPRNCIPGLAIGRLPRLAHRGRPGGGAAHSSGHHRRRGIHGRRRRAVDPRRTRRQAGRPDRRPQPRVHRCGGDRCDGLRPARHARNRAFPNADNTMLLAEAVGWAPPT